METEPIFADRAKNPRHRVFAVRIGLQLLYATITSNPSKTLRYYSRLGRKDPPEDAFLSELELRRKVKMTKKEVYIGPMR